MYLVAKQRRNRARTNATPLCKIDPLEPRLHLAAVAWTGAAGDNLWHTPGNWSTNAVPTVDDDVTISIAANPTIQFTSATGSRSIRSLVSDEVLALQGGSLSVAETGVLNAPSSLSGATLSGGIWTLNAPFTLGGGTISGGQWNTSTGLFGGPTATLLTNAIVQGDLIAEGSAKLKVSGTTRFTSARLRGGASSIEFVTGYLLHDLVLAEGAAAGTRSITVANASSVQIAPDGVLRLAPDCGGDLSLNNTTSTTFENQGLIESLAPGRLLKLAVNNFLNSGTILADAGSLELASTVWRNNASLTVTNSATLTTAFTWKNYGTITLDNSTFNLGGTVKPSEFFGAGFHRTGGIVNFSGTIYAYSSTFTLDEVTGPWNVFGGIFRGGTFTLKNADPSWIAVRTQLVLDSAVVLGDISLDYAGANMLLKSTARFGTLRLAAPNTSATLGMNYALKDRILATGAGTQADSRIVNVEASYTATIGPTGEIRLTEDCHSRFEIAGYRKITNNGLILAEDGAGATIHVSLESNNGVVRAYNAALEINDFTNKGTIEVLGVGSLTLSGGEWSNQGVIRVAPRGYALFMQNAYPNTGTFELSECTVTIHGLAERTIDVLNFANWNLLGASVLYRGTLNLLGKSLTIGQTGGTWTLDQGAISNGTIHMLDAQPITCVGWGGTLTDVVVEGDIRIASLLNVNGATRFHAAVIRGHNATLDLLTQYTLHDQVRFEGPSGLNRTLRVNVGLEIAPTGSIVTDEGMSGAVVVTARDVLTTGITNRGLVEVRSPGTTLKIGETIRNVGMIRCNGGTIDINAFGNYDDLNDRLVGGTLIVEHGGILRTPDIQRNAANLTIADPGSTFEALDVFSVNEGSFHLLRGATLHVSNGVRSLVNYGLIDIDHASTLQLSDPFKQDPVGTLRLGVGPDGSFARLLTPGAATLAGTLDIAYDQYVFSRGDEFQLLSAASIVGIFDHANVGGYHGFDRDAIRYGASGVSLRILAAADTNGDGYVNGQDYDSFADLFDSGSLLADLDGDGIVTIDDFALFVAAFMHG